MPWTLPALRREWNQAKGEVAPWWPENSKEAAEPPIAGFVSFTVEVQRHVPSGNGKTTVVG